MTAEAPNLKPQREVSEAGSRNRPLLYFFLFAAQTVGASILLVNGVPVYREAAGDFSKHRPHPGILWWAVAAVVIIQAAYWAGVRLQLGPPQGGHVVIGHVAAFMARLSFIIASSTFTLVFFLRFEDLNLPLHRILMILAMLFSLFCYSLELERLARALHGVERTR